MPESEKGFEIKDKRRAKEALDEKGESEPEAAAAETQAAPESDRPAEATAGERPDEKGPKHEAQETGRQLPPIDFMAFIGSLAATAFLHMGEKLSSDQPELPVDLASAKQMIDLIDLIKVKTRGNLEKHEEDGLESILYNLRMRYLHKSAGK